MAARKSASSAVVQLVPPAPVLPAAIVGTIVAFEQGRGCIVDYPGNPAGPVPARLLVALDRAALRRAAAARTPAALLFEGGDPERPLIVGLVQDAAPRRRSRVAGKRVVVTGEEELELRCGEASISLKKDGKLVIRGAYVETHARGTNRIKGGSVQIN
ncbi:DUF6484 domain-containing protein [Nannocystis sp. ILAH1]|uniref:DUF6484 domain-containing protein n=1 Tax=unclassified Nannocystis TaxID=2627009 RepID=UPI0022711213|nr:MULTISPECIES: DUF6484 domain-containing protein [unclassified Nannocystis]MCY0986565.1 DUF6484 domain-containing protein [Nannocystis sp. ILAH1]MCY1071445.1 DUF6484 domain-containing protein [Nannocystis sp. RBIL2]